MTRAVTAPRRPSLTAIRQWPATCSVEDAAAAIGISRTTAYELVRAGEAPFAVIKVRGRRRVITSSLIRLLAAGAGDAA
jgi:excisionase family DNA binding protein